MGRGKVFLVGAGPGDPKLITVRGLEALQMADTVVYDRLASPRLLRHLKPGTEKIYVGKLPDRHTMKQEEINQLLVDLALQGKVVTRLKGGDPSVFGRVGEEAELLVDNGIEFEIVPGITSAIAVPAYAGIPVTHREFASSFAVVTGHENPTKLDTSINWEKVATATDTVIFLMGVAKIDYIADQMMKWGRRPETPVALIRWGTRIEQRTLTGTLADIADKVKEADFQPPAIILIGEVVKTREKLKWFEKKPLFGKRVLITRARSQSSELADMIDELGGEAVEFPVIQIQQPSSKESMQALDEALAKLAEYDWVLFTSVNGVEYFFRRLKELRLDVRTMANARLAAVGPKTAEALLDRGLLADVLPTSYQGEGLLDALLPHLKPGQRILLPRAHIARKYVPQKLKESGMVVTEVEVYENVASDEHADDVIEMLREGDIHVITFTSSSTVTNLMEIIKRAGVETPLDLLRSVDIACIGPLTVQTAEQFGLHANIVSKEATILSLIEALTEYNKNES